MARQLKRPRIFANYNPVARGWIAGLTLAGMNPNQICQNVVCNIKTVKFWSNRYEAGGDAALSDHRRNHRRQEKNYSQTRFEYVKDNPYKCLNSPGGDDRFHNTIF